MDAEEIYIVPHPRQEAVWECREYDPDLDDYHVTIKRKVSDCMVYRSRAHYDQIMAHDAAMAEYHRQQATDGVAPAITKARRLAAATILPLSLFAFSILAIGGAAEGIRLFTQFLDTGVLP